MNEDRTVTGLGSGGRYSKPDNPICAGCEHQITGKALWECGVQWHEDCLPPHPMIDPLDSPADQSGKGARS